MDIRQAMATDLTDSVGAAKLLSKRFHRNFSVDSVHQLVKQKKLRAFLFDDGELVERAATPRTRGKDLLFLYADLYALEPPRKPGRPVEQAKKETEELKE
jgi:hypothetical protein